MSVLEVAQIVIKDGEAAQFEEAFAQAIEYVRGASGHISSSLNQTLDSPGRYVFLVVWETLADHVDNFANSPQFTAFGELIGDFFAAPPEVTHFSEIGA